MPAPSVTDLDKLPEVLTVSQLQELFGISKLTSYNLVDRPGFPAIRFGRAIRIPREALKEWMSTQRGQQKTVALVDAEEG